MGIVWKPGEPEPTTAPFTGEPRVLVPPTRFEDGRVVLELPLPQRGVLVLQQRDPLAPPGRVRPSQGQPGTYAHLLGHCRHGAEGYNPLSRRLTRYLNTVGLGSALRLYKSGISLGKVGAWAPPSTAMTLPVTKPAAGDANHTAAAAMSSTLASRRRGVAAVT